jgi:hypothetical protein
MGGPGSAPVPSGSQLTIVKVKITKSRGSRLSDIRHLVFKQDPASSSSSSPSRSSFSFSVKQVFCNPLKVPPQRQASPTSCLSKFRDSRLSVRETDVVGIIILQPFREPERGAGWKNNLEKLLTS